MVKVSAKPTTETFEPAVTTFLKGLDWKIGIEWYGKTGITLLKRTKAALPYSRIVKLVFDHSGCAIEIKDRTRGLLDSQDFRYRDYLDPKARDDERPDHKDGFHTWEDKGRWAWYIAKPTSTRPFCAAVEKYLDTWELDD